MSPAWEKTLIVAAVVAAVAIAIPLTIGSFVVLENALGGFTGRALGAVLIPIVVTLVGVMGLVALADWIRRK
jgi:hypothetical protein